MEQDHRGVKQRSYPMRGFGRCAGASRFCRAFDEVRQFERYRRTRTETGSLAERRQQFVDGTAALQAMLLVT